ncbi:MAG: hypothetical protein P4L56_03870 [Candidatus Sulfopaludibacter sp.]|nr:hypothetical protein [Candidatus Sulfopaludibacter sp.]
MPIQSPQLDDLRYDTLVQQLMRRIPVYTPEWTDWNDSDPGITMLQLVSYVAEQVGYRLNLVPEKTYIALLQLLGIELAPALAATTRIGIFLSDPTTLDGFTLDAPSRFMGSGNTPAIFESDVDVDIIPAEPAVLLATKNPFLWDLLLVDAAGDRDPAPTDAQLPKQIPTADCRWVTVVWDGKKPANKDLPVAPVPLLPVSATGVAHPYLWAGIDCNLDREAGFTGVTVTLTVQFDDDEQPDPRADIVCRPINAAGEVQPPPIDWLAYFDANRNAMVQVPGRIDDWTNELTQSGTIRFTIPSTVGPIPLSMFANLRDAVTPAPVDACSGFVQNLRDSLTGSGTTIDTATLQTLLTNALTAAQSATATAAPAVGYPLDPSLYDPTKLLCWLRIGPLNTTAASPRLRYIGFNVVPVTNAVTVNNELLGYSDGRPGQTFQLAHGNILAGTLQVGILESAAPNALLTAWTRIASLDTTGPNDSVFELDAEAGVLTFGDGNNGRIPPLVVTAGAVIALAYRWGGGLSGDQDAGAITTSAAQFNGLAAVVNFVAASGGRDTETLDAAKLRARKELSTRSRAVTASDFEWIALQTPTVLVRRAIVVPRRRPLSLTVTPLQQQLCAPSTVTPPAATAPGPTGPCAPPGGLSGCSTPVSYTANTVSTAAISPILYSASPAASDCGPPLPAPPAGLDDNFEAPGVVTVVVVPDGPEPPPAVRPSLVELVPTPSFLRAVCAQLDLYRLVTTEVHVVPPQYMRLCRVYCRVKAQVGYTRLQVRDLVANTLATYLDVLLGGDDGQGSPFGGQVHIAQLMAQVFRTTGVERVDDLRAHFVRTKSNAPFREGNLVLCPTATGDYEHVDLSPEETTSLDLTSFTLDTV